MRTRPITVACVGLLLIGAVVCHAGEAGEDAADLRAKLQAYFAAKARGAKRRAYAKIEAHPLGSIEHVTAALRSRRTYSPAEPGLVGHELKGKSGRSVGTYTAIVPNDYDPDRAWPVILALAGGRGDGAGYAPFWQRTLQGQTYLIVCPVARDLWWHNSHLIAMAALKDAFERYHVDRDRVYVTGMSNGGSGAWFMAMHYPDLFAAAAPMAGCPQTGKGRIDYPFLLNLVNVPVYACHGAGDETIAPKFDRKAIELLSAQAYDCQLDEIPDGNHGSPHRRVNEILAWFANKRRNPAPRRIRFLKQSKKLTRCYWLLIGKTKRASIVEARITAPNTIELKSQRVAQLVLFLNDQLVAMDQPITIHHNGRLLKTVQPAPNLRTLLLSAQVFDDPARLFPVEISLKLPE